MRRTTVMLSDDLDARLRFEARRRGGSIADVAREAIAAYLPEPADADRFTFIDAADADGDAAGDLSERVDEEVSRLVRERHEQESRR